MNIDRRKVDILMAQCGFFRYKDLASAAGLSPDHLSRVLNRGSCNARIAIKIATALRVFAPALQPPQQPTPPTYELPTLEELLADHDGMASRHPLRSIPDFISSPVPLGWNGWPVKKRIAFWAKGGDADVLVARDRICAREVWVEALGEPLHAIRHSDAVMINKAIAITPGWQRAKGSICFGPYGKQRGWVCSK